MSTKDWDLRNANEGDSYLGSGTFVMQLEENYTDYMVFMKVHNEEECNVFIIYCSNVATTATDCIHILW